MQILPVIDVIRGQVVRGAGGRRDEYRPIRSPLCRDAQPASVAAAFGELGFHQLYVADLDAIQRQAPSPAWPLYAELLSLGLDLWIDAGLATAAEARDMARFEAAGRPIAGIVAGLESLSDPDALDAMCAAVGRERLVFSLDLKQGMPLVGSTAWRGLSAEQIAAVAWRAGVRRMIVLDLANVGMNRGVGTLPVCRALRCRYPELQLVAGGGVRGPADLLSLARAGCDAALVASALHDGRISIDDARGRQEAPPVTIRRIARPATES